MKTPHLFRVQTFGGPTWCAVCGTVLLGLYRQGHTCEVCGLAVHSHCQRLAHDLKPCGASGAHSTNHAARRGVVDRAVGEATAAVALVGNWAVKARAELGFGGVGATQHENSSPPAERQAAQPLHRNESPLASSAFAVVDVHVLSAHWCSHLCSSTPSGAVRLAAAAFLAPKAKDVTAPHLHDTAPAAAGTGGGGAAAAAARQSHRPSTATARDHLGGGGGVVATAAAAAAAAAAAKAAQHEDSEWHHPHSPTAPTPTSTPSNRRHEPAASTNGASNRDSFVRVKVGEAAERTPTAYQTSWPQFGSHFVLPAAHRQQSLSVVLIDATNDNVVGAVQVGLMKLLQREADAQAGGWAALLDQPLELPLCADTSSTNIDELKFEAVTGHVRLRVRVREAVDLCGRLFPPRVVPTPPNEEFSVDVFRRHVDRAMAVVQWWTDLETAYNRLIGWESPVVSALSLAVFVWACLWLDAEHAGAAPCLVLVLHMAHRWWLRKTGAFVVHWTQHAKSTAGAVSGARTTATATGNASSRGSGGARERLPSASREESFAMDDGGTSETRERRARTEEWGSADDLAVPPMDGSTDLGENSDFQPLATVRIAVLRGKRLGLRQAAQPDAVVTGLGAAGGQGSLSPGRAYVRVSYNERGQHWPVDTDVPIGSTPSSALSSNPSWVDVWSEAASAHRRRAAVPSLLRPLVDAFLPSQESGLPEDASVVHSLTRRWPKAHHPQHQNRHQNTEHQHDGSDCPADHAFFHPVLQPIVSDDVSMHAWHHSLAVAPGALLPWRMSQAVLRFSVFWENPADQEGLAEDLLEGHVTVPLSSLVADEGRGGPQPERQGWYKLTAPVDDTAPADMSATPATTNDHEASGGGEGSGAWPAIELRLQLVLRDPTEPITDEAREASAAVAEATARAAATKHSVALLPSSSSQSLFPLDDAPSTASSTLTTLFGLRDTAASVQNWLASTLDQIESTKNLLNWTHPSKSSLVFAAAVMLWLLFVFVPTRYVILAVGCFEFGKAFIPALQPPPADHVPAGSLPSNLLAAVANDEDLRRSYTTEAKAFGQRQEAMAKKRRRRARLRALFNCQWEGSVRVRAGTSATWASGGFTVLQGRRVLWWRSERDLEGGRPAAAQLLLQGHAGVTAPSPKDVMDMGGSEARLLAVFGRTVAGGQERWVFVTATAEDKCAFSAAITSAVDKQD